MSEYMKKANSESSSNFNFGSPSPDDSTGDKLIYYNNLELHVVLGRTGADSDEDVECWLRGIF